MRAIHQPRLTDRKTAYSLQTSGVFEVAYTFRATEEYPGLYAGWLMGLLGLLLAWIRQIRSESGVAVEYALAAEVVAVERPVHLVEYGVGSVAESYGFSLPGGNHVFPTMSIGPIDEFPIHLTRFNEDLWNLADQDIGHNTPKFQLQFALTR